MADVPQTEPAEASADEPPSPEPTVRYKVVETSAVTDDVLEGIINDWVGQGWQFDGMQFAMRESSKRPAMAFLLFTRENPTRSNGT